MTRRPDALLLVAVLASGYFALPTPRGAQQRPERAASEAVWDLPASPARPDVAALREAPEPSQSGLGFAQPRPQRRETWTPTAPAPQSRGYRETIPHPQVAKPRATTRPKAPRSGPTDRTQAKYGVPWLVRAGLASHMGGGYPSGYLALPHGPGWLARICGAGDCVVMASNDAGPSLARQREGRIADLSVTTFEKVCGVPSSLGLCEVSVTILGKAK